MDWTSKSVVVPLLGMAREPGPNSIGKKILTIILSKSYIKEFKQFKFILVSFSIWTFMRIFVMIIVRIVCY